MKNEFSIEDQLTLVDKNDEELNIAFLTIEKIYKLSITERLPYLIKHTSLSPEDINAFSSLSGLASDNSVNTTVEFLTPRTETLTG